MSKAKSKAQERRRLRRREKQLDIPSEKMLGKVARRRYGGGLVAK